MINCLIKKRPLSTDGQKATRNLDRQGHTVHSGYISINCTGI
jgi:hypothetical protein